MIISKQEAAQDDGIQIDGMNLERVKELNYFRTEFNNQWGSSIEVKNRIAKVGATFVKMKQVRCNELMFRSHNKDASMLCFSCNIIQGRNFTDTQFRYVEAFKM